MGEKEQETPFHRGDGWPLTRHVVLWELECGLEGAAILILLSPSTRGLLAFLVTLVPLEKVALG